LADILVASSGELSRTGCVTMPKPNGTLIRRRRQERGLTVDELAARVGFTNPASMRNIENRNDPTAMIKLCRIARELGIAVDDVLAPTEKSP
jgi:transcriptional regulator with XRE-family HTH domain